MVWRTGKCVQVGLILVSWWFVSGTPQQPTVDDDSSDDTPPIELLTGGTRPSEYLLAVFSPTSNRRFASFMSAQIFARATASKGPEDYAALFYRLDASGIRGHRVMLQAVVTPANMENGAWAGLFVRVDAADGRVLAFDNMADRPVMGSYVGNTTEAAVVVQVPGGDGEDEGGDACPDPDAVPAAIVVGVFLCGGRGTARFEAAELKRVGAEYPLTTGAGVWSNPALDDLGPGTPWLPGRSPWFHGGGP